MLFDTSPDAEQAQIEAIRKLSTAQRMSLVRSLSAMTIGLSRRAIARANPDLTPEDVNVKFVELHYGPEIARALSEYVGQRR